MDTFTSILRVVHVVTAVLMAWPYYALVVVHQRSVLGPPLGDRADVYMEQTIRNRVIPCFVLQGTAMASGLWLIFRFRGGFDDLVDNSRLGAKFLLLVFIAGLLAYVHFRLQPKLDSLFIEHQRDPGNSDVGERIGQLRLYRKRFASVCLFCVLTMVMLGVQTWAAFDTWLTWAMVAAIAAFTYRTYRSGSPYGWA
jgi:hypothetical protein